MKTDPKSPAHPISLKVGNNAVNFAGMNKREYFAAHAYAEIPLYDKDFLEQTLGRKINQKDHMEFTDAQCEALAIIKLKIADKLIEQLNKS